jgi:poly(3-hydroxybutyrate) depolymerase
VKRRAEPSAGFGLLVLAYLRGAKNPLQHAGYTRGAAERLDGDSDWATFGTSNVVVNNGWQTTNDPKRFFLTGAAKGENMAAWLYSSMEMG